jgi:hypothetical protein
VTNKLTFPSLFSLLFSLTHKGVVITAAKTTSEGEIRDSEFNGPIPRHKPKEKSFMTLKIEFLGDRCKIFVIWVERQHSA